MKIVFLGTPEFALPSLSALIEDGHTLEVFTQPDRPVGRHGAPVAPPVKQLALSHGIPVRQFEKIRSEEGVAALCAFAPDLMVTAAFGQLLSQANLDIPKHGCINVHGSLLPRYRGAAPIQWAVINGETETGITTMLTDIGMDTGDILLKESTPIGPDETAGELYVRLSVMGAELLRRTIAALEAGTLTREKQNEADASKCPMLKKEHGKLDLSQSAQRVHNLVRGVNPWPGAFALWDGAPLKIWKTRLCKRENPRLPAGTCIGDAKQGLFLQCGDGLVEVLELQAPGGRRMDGRSFLRGKSLEGAVLQ